MLKIEQLPADFQECVRFHGHSCPGLAIGYAAAKIGAQALKVKRSADEEVVAIVENDSCAVDGVQVLFGCTFGKGNLIFRNWGKQVFTFLSRKDGRGVRVAFRGMKDCDDERRRALKQKIDAGNATAEDMSEWHQLRDKMTLDLVTGDAAPFFDVREAKIEIPPEATVVPTAPCGQCGEATMASRMVEKDGQRICRACAEGQLGP